MTNTNEIELRSYKVSEADTGFALKIECLSKLVPIERPAVSIAKKANEHTRAVITGFINQNTYENFALHVASDMDVKITCYIEGEAVFLFQGIIKQLVVDTQGLGANIVYELTIEALSYTRLMDMEKKSRSFQNAGMTYDEMLEHVISGYHQSVVLNHGATGTLGTFTMQYQETDWEYLMRMASRFYVPLIADHKSGGPRFSVGTGESTAAVTFGDYEYKIVKAAEDYRINLQNNQTDIYETDFIYYDITTIGPDMESLEVGEAVWFQEKLLYIIAAEARVKDYVLSHTYRLGGKNGLFSPPVFNESVRGLSLQGTVIKAARNMLKVHLDIDLSQAESTAHWFQYATFYATWYCMPEIGDRVNVHFPTVEESEGIVLNSVRKASSGRAAKTVGQAGAGSQQKGAAKTGGQAGTALLSAVAGSAQEAGGIMTMGESVGMSRGETGSESESQTEPAFDLETLSSDEKVKMIATDSGKMLILDDRNGSVSIVCNDGTYITLSDSDGISIISNMDIMLSSNKDINITADDMITVNAESSLKLTCDGSKIELDPAMILINGDDIKLNS